MKKTATLSEAVTLLGYERVITEKTARDLWGIGSDSDDQDTQILTSFFESCAEANKLGLANWYLVYGLGLSLFDQLDMRFEKEFCFCDKHQRREVMLRGNEEGWSHKGYESGYYLLDFGYNDDRAGRLEGLSLFEQEEVIKLRPSKMRAPEQLVCEAIFDLYDNFNLEVMENWNHIGQLKMSDGLSIYVGHATKRFSGIHVFGMPRGHEQFPSYGFGVVLAMKK